jgi:hypothetical protein
MSPRPHLCRLAAALAGAALIAAIAAPGAAPAAERAPGPRLLRADAAGAAVELRTPAVVPRPGGGLAVAGVPDAAAERGLPTFTAALGVPPGAAVALSAPDGELRPLPAGLAAPAGLVAPASGCTPAASITGDAWMRGQRVVTLALSPVAVCAGGQLRWRPAITAELSWTGGAAPAGAPADPLLDAALPTALLNYAQARQWRAAPAAPPAPQLAAERYKISVVDEGLYTVTYADLQAAGAPVNALDPRSFSLSGRDGPAAILVAGEADGRFDPGDSLSFYGQPLDARPVRDSVILDGRLVVADTVVSRTYSADTDYGDRNVYWLEFGGAPGPRMAALAAPPDPAAPAPASFRHTARAEESLWWWTWHFTGRDPWFWTRTTLSGPLTETLPIALPAPDPQGEPAAVHAELVALSHSPAVAPDHRTRLALNGAPFLDAAWDGPSRLVAADEVPAAALVEGPNQLAVGHLLQPGVGADTIYFDFFTVTYSRLFRAEGDRLRFDYPAGAPRRFRVSGLSGPEIRALDVSSPLAPRLLGGVEIAADGGGFSASFSPPGGGGGFLVVGPGGGLRPAAVERRTPSGLAAAGNGADYIVVAPAELRAAAESLAAYRAARGMRVVVADLGAVIDEFNAGIYHPVAIKRFLAYAYAAWQGPAPQYVLLLGDGHWNLRGFSPGRYGGGGPVLMPPNLAWVDPFQGQVDSANQLAAFVGDDILPDVAIGRLTARNAADVAAALAKTAAHEAAPANAPWRSRLLFVADNQPDAAGDFRGAAERVIAETVPADKLAVDRLYLDDLCGPAQNPPRPCPQLTAALTDALNLSGTLMLTYSGHGAVQRWAHEAVFTNAAAAGLRNGDKPPLVVSLDCLDGYWSYPGTESLIETLVRQQGGGAAAAFSPTGLGVATGHEALQRGLHAALFAGGPQRLGPATMAAKLALFAGSTSRDLVDTYTVFGDPALALALPESVTGPPPATPTPTPPPATPGERRVYLPLARAGGR